MPRAWTRWRSCPCPPRRRRFARGWKPRRFRGLRKPEEVAGVLEALQALVLEHAETIESIDVNPLLVTGEGCVAVDALIVLRT